MKTFKRENFDIYIRLSDIGVAPISKYADLNVHIISQPISQEETSSLTKFSPISDQHTECQMSNIADIIFNCRCISVIYLRSLLRYAIPKLRFAEAPMGVERLEGGGGDKNQRVRNVTYLLFR
jgi:hypothetical protein